MNIETRCWLHQQSCVCTPHFAARCVIGVAIFVTYVILVRGLVSFWNLADDASTTPFQLAPERPQTVAREGVDHEPRPERIEAPRGRMQSPRYTVISGEIGSIGEAATVKDAQKLWRLEHGPRPAVRVVTDVPYAPQPATSTPSQQRVVRADGSVLYTNLPGVDDVGSHPRPPALKVSSRASRR